MQYWLIYELKYGGYNVVVFEELNMLRDYVYEQCFEELGVKYYVVHGTVI